VAERQLDLFAADRIGVEQHSGCEKPLLRAAELDDTALVAALPDAGLTSAPSLAAEAARRRLAEAVPALDRLCRRLTGFGADRLVPEQAAALEALAAIGGAAARQTVARLITDRIVQGPTLAVALSTAARLGAPLPASRLTELLRDADPSIRAGACRCVRSAAPHLGVLCELLDDLHAHVAAASAIALGRLGRVEARPPLMELFRRQPSAEVIKALAPIANEEVIVAFGRIARAMPDLFDVALDTLEQLDDPRAARVALALRARAAVPGRSQST
jgi:HEAT repeats